MDKQIVNLKSLIQAAKTDQLLAVYLTVNDGAFAKNRAKTLAEAKVLAHLAEQLIKLPNFGTAKQGGYILNFPFTDVVREEFDVLRFSEHTVLNIELKSQFPRKKNIIDQLRRHKIILDRLGKQTILCTYVKAVNNVYLLKNDQLQPITLKTLTQLIEEDYLMENELTQILTPSKEVAAPLLENESILKFIFQDERQ